MARFARSPATQSYGIQLGQVTATLFNRTGSAANYGQLVMLDLGLTATETTVYTFGSDVSGYSNFVDPTAAGASTGRFWFGLVNAAGGIADDASGEVLLQGKHPAGLVIRDSGSVAVFDQLIADTTNMSLEGMGTLTAGYTILGRAEQALTTPVSNTAGAVLFDGIDFTWGVVPA